MKIGRARAELTAARRLEARKRAEFLRDLTLALRSDPKEVEKIAKGLENL